MNAAAITHDEARTHGASPATSRFGMVTFIVSEAMLFGGIIAGYMVLRLSRPGDWPPPGAPDIGVKLPPDLLNWVMIINSLILISSSFTYHYAEAAVKKKGRSGLGWMLLTMLLGATFLSVQAWEWLHLHHEHLWFNTFGIYGSCFFVTTGFHGMHVLVGLILILWVFARQLFGRAFTPARHTALDNVGIYWHFVDGVWIVVFTLFYVI